MKAIVLAAGRGSRLGPLTDEKPKALVPLNGEPLIARTVHTLRAGGIEQVGLVCGYRAEMLEPFADRVFPNPQWATTGIFHSLGCAAEWLESEPCIVSYGDIFYSPRLVRDLAASDEAIDVAYDVNAVALWKQRFENPLDDMERFAQSDGAITRIGGKATSVDEIEGQYMGLFKLTPQTWRELKQLASDVVAPRRDNVDMTSLISLLIQAGRRVGARPTIEPWGEIDCPSDVALYERLYPQL